MNVKFLLFLLMPFNCNSLFSNLVMKRNEFNLAKDYYDFLKKHNKIETIEIKNFNLISQEI